MKKIMLIIIAACLTATGVQAQNVYKEVLRMAEKAVADKSKTVETRKINLFKKDALNYMAMKTHEAMPDSSVTVLDYQAFALYEYVSLYVSKLGKTDKKKEKAAILDIFKNASVNNPRFFDMDKPLVLSYYGNDNYLTQFSLDTDWVKALAEARRVLRESGK